MPEFPGAQVDELRKIRAYLYRLKIRYVRIIYVIIYVYTYVYIYVYIILEFRVYAVILYVRVLLRGCVA